MSEGERLPELAGGWERRSFTVPGRDGLQLWVPRSPDLLLDDEGVHERNRFNDSMPYWAWLWDSAPAMVAGLVAENWAPGVRVLEMGAGLGLVGLALAHAHGVDVTLTDHDPLAVEALQAQVRASGLPGVRACSFDWNEPESAPERSYDGVIGCDVLYEARFHLPILQALVSLLERGGVAWIADPGRNRLPGFLGRARDAGFQVELRDSGGLAAEFEAGEYRLVRLERA